ncbi:MAG: hypothetical protein IJX77_07195, partial [Ruminococcus sp.]|nr:hypothetical protein [Ruminococcus sp.]
TLLKKGSPNRRLSPLSASLTSPHTVGSHPQTPFLKLSVLNFSPIGYTLEKILDFSVVLDVYPMGLKFRLKVFGRGFGGEPFFRKVSPD